VTVRCGPVLRRTEEKGLVRAGAKSSRHVTPDDQSGATSRRRSGSNSRRPSHGGHYAIEEVIRAQFGPALRAFGGLRRRRIELEYPLYPAEQANRSEAAETIEITAEIIEAATKLVPNLGFF